MGRNSPLGGHGWISSPERRETARNGHPLTPEVNLLNDRNALLLGRPVRGIKSGDSFGFRVADPLLCPTGRLR